MSSVLDKAREAFAEVGVAEAEAKRQRAIVGNLKVRHHQAVAKRERLREEKDHEAAHRLLQTTEEESTHG